MCRGTYQNTVLSVNPDTRTSSRPSLFRSAITSPAGPPVAPEMMLPTGDMLKVGGPRFAYQRTCDQARSPAQSDTGFMTKKNNNHILRPPH
jgi:hypothetical protein